jgi:aryl-alcohol dehydrogenase-like predicted oxidoreductase
LNQLKEQGKIRAIGVSNFSRTQLEEASQYGRIDSLQPPYSLLWRQVEKDAMPYCVENNISILAYSSLAQGLLTGKFERGINLRRGITGLKISCSTVRTTNAHSKPWTSFAQLRSVITVA